LKIRISAKSNDSGLGVEFGNCDQELKIVQPLAVTAGDDKRLKETQSGEHTPINGFNGFSSVIPTSTPKE